MAANGFYRLPILIVLALAAGAFLNFLYSRASDGGVSLPPEEVGSFEECAEKGYARIPAQPDQCTTPDGRTFIDDSFSPSEK